jgi:DNA-binding response OmpR family regulator
VTFGIVVSGRAIADHAPRAKAAGCDVVVTTPYLPENLVKLIRSLLTRQPAGRNAGLTGIRPIRSGAVPLKTSKVCREEMSR